MPCADINCAPPPSSFAHFASFAASTSDGAAPINRAPPPENSPCVRIARSLFSSTQSGLASSSTKSAPDENATTGARRVSADVTTKPPAASFTTWKDAPFMGVQVRTSLTAPWTGHPSAGSSRSHRCTAVFAWSAVTVAADTAPTHAPSETQNAILNLTAIPPLSFRCSEG